MVDLSMHGVKDWCNLRRGSGEYIAKLVLATAFGLAVLTGCYSWPFDTRPQTYAVALGDLDGDDDPDAYLANGQNEGTVPDSVWINDGSGMFIHPFMQPFKAETHFVDLGDLDGDGDLDAMTGTTGGAVAAFNNGKGYFNKHVRLFAEDSGAYIVFPALGDLDGDGDLDLALGACCGSQTDPTTTGQTGIRYSSNMVWFNDGHGHFKDSRQRLGFYGTSGLALEDMDGDGDLDIFAANSSSIVNRAGEPETNQPDMVWLNDGKGYFSDSGQRLGEKESYSVALGDLDEDGDLDAFVGNHSANIVWLNDGTGHFYDSGQALGTADTRQVMLADLDADGDIDAYTAGRGFGETWINQGRAQGGKSGVYNPGQSIAFSGWFASTISDVDADCDVDILAGLLDQRIRVWLNDGAGKYAPKYDED